MVKSKLHNNGGTFVSTISLLVCPTTTAQLSSYITVDREIFAVKIFSFIRGSDEI